MGLDRRSTAKSGAESVHGEDMLGDATRAKDGARRDMPACVVDIQYGRDTEFEFVVALRGPGQGGRVRLGVDSLEGMDSAQRHWLLAKFRAHLRALLVVGRLTTWVFERLSLLKEYCEAWDLQFEDLRMRSALHRGVDTDTDEAVDPHAECTKKRSNSLSERADDTTRESVHGVAKPKSVRMRRARDSLRSMLAKHGTRRRIDKETLLADLEALRVHIFDV